MTKEGFESKIFATNAKGIGAIWTMSYGGKTWHFYCGSEDMKTCMEDAMNDAYTGMKLGIVEKVVFIAVDKPINPMCRGCSNLFTDCSGSSNLIWTGCVYRNKKI